MKIHDCVFIRTHHRARSWVSLIHPNTFTPYTSKISLNIMPRYTPGPTKWPVPPMFSDKNSLCISYFHLRMCIQEFSDWVDKETYAYKNKHSLRSNTKVCGGRTHQTEPPNSDLTAPSGRELYSLQFSLQAASPESFGYTLISHLYVLPI
jgi:hypothetical protein